MEEVRGTNVARNKLPEVLRATPKLPAFMEHAALSVTTVL